MLIEVTGAALVIGRTSRGISTRLEPGLNDVADDHWTEIVSRYLPGLAPHLASGRLSIHLTPLAPPDPPPEEPATLSTPSLPLERDPEAGTASPASGSLPEPLPAPKPRRKPRRRKKVV